MTLMEVATKAPTIRIEFLLDGAGNPRCSEHEDRDGAMRRHYDVRVTLDDPPEDTWSVTFFLHESYYNPVRETRGPEFTFETSTYGDYIIKAQVSRKKSCDVLAVNVSDALKAQYGPSAGPAIQKAIKEIEAN